MTEKKTTTRGRKRSSKKTGSKSNGSKSGGRKTANGRALVVVESPAKAKTINKYLGSDYVVKASMGHVRDLPAHGLGVEIENQFAPTYELVPGRKKVLNELRKYAEKASEIYLATDLDREGEAIAWHLGQELGLEESQMRRVVFNEITQSAIREAFEHPREIDMDKVNAQQARRILDRIVGYELSPLLWKKIAKGLSAGRVQSVAVKLIAEREREIQAFIPTEYWAINGFFGTQSDATSSLEGPFSEFLEGDNGQDRTQKDINAWLAQHESLQAAVSSVNGESFKPEGTLKEGGDFASAVGQVRQVAEALGFEIESQDESVWEDYQQHGLKKVLLQGRLATGRLPTYTVSQVQKRRTSTKPSPPFTTATLQQAASTILRFSTSRTMSLAQQLYEGLELKGEDGPIGLITYMRTDSTNLSKDSVGAARDYVKQNHGDSYLPAKPQVYSSSKRAQEAHEAIRPTDVRRTPESLKGQLTGPQWRLYDLIWRRFVACQMERAQWDSTTILIKAETSAGAVEFRTSGRTLAFDGFYRVMGLPKADGEAILPELEEGQTLGVFRLDPKQQFTSPPPRYTQASLVKRLESEGIGRPSTYASIIQTTLDRGYVEELERRLYATDKGLVVTDKLVEHFPDVMDVSFTSFMEDELDKIEEAHLDWVKVLNEFYDPFHRGIVRAHENMEAAKAEPSPYKCDLCGSDMVYRWAKTGRFLSCSQYPECKGAFNIDREGKPIKQQAPTVQCEECGKDMILRQSRHGSFLGCSGYPECTNTIPCDQTGQPLKLVEEKDVEKTCSECEEGTLKVKRKGMRAFLGCDRYPNCRHTEALPEGVRLERKTQPVEEAGVTCDRCGRPMVIRTGRRGKFIACSGFPKCRSTKQIEKLEELQKAEKDKPKKTPPPEPAKGKAGSSGSTTKKKAASKGKKSGKVDLDELGPPPPGFAWTRTGKPVVETMPEDELHCPECGSEMQLKAGRFGPFFSCTNFPKCKCSVNLRGEAKKQAEIDMPPPQKAKPIPTDIPCDECGEPMLIRSGRSGKFLGCSKYPKCKFTKPVPPELLISSDKQPASDKKES